jgi:hypothetical protein
MEATRFSPLSLDLLADLAGTLVLALEVGVHVLVLVA